MKQSKCVITALMMFACWPVHSALAATPIKYTSFKDSDQGRAVRVHVVEVDLTDSRIDIDLAMANGKSSKLEPVSTMAARNQAVAAINGSFFHGTTVDAPVGLVVKKGEIISDSGHRRTSLGITADRKYMMGIPKIETGLDMPQENRFQAINGVNQARKYHQTIVYTPRFGDYTHTNQYGREVVVQKNKVIRYSYGNTKIPRDGFVISSHGKTKNIQTLYPLGTAVSLQVKAEAPWDRAETIVTGAPHLVKQGRIHNTFFQEKLNQSLKRPNSRSAIGLTHNHKLLMMNVFPEKGNSGGVTLTRLAQIMLRIGAYEAMALDGGGSTSLYVSEKGMTHHAKRPVTNALIVKMK